MAAHAAPARTPSARARRARSAGAGGGAKENAGPVVETAGKAVGPVEVRQPAQAPRAEPLGEHQHQLAAAESAAEHAESAAPPADVGPSAPPPLPRNPRARPRALAGAPAPGPAAEPPSPPDNDYERERNARIARNREMLQALQVKEAAAAAAPARPSARGPPGPRPPRPARERGPAPEPLPTRTSARKRGLEPDGSERAAGGDDDGGEAAGREELLTLEAYWEEKGGNPCPDPVVSDGRYRGWVEAGVRARCGIPATADEAWEAGGGGKFSFKIDKSAIPASLKARGWSDARAFAATQLVKNPNAYFYRHVEPGRQQATGEWTAEEHATFVATAREHGVGDKWGLFSSFLPERVGYQCSAYYREVVIPAGLVLDARFRLTRGGRAVYVG